MTITYTNTLTLEMDELTYTLSAHAQYDRMERIEAMKAHGFGHEVATVNTFDKCNRFISYVVTSEGIVFVIDLEDRVVRTEYYGRPSRVRKLMELAGAPCTKSFMNKVVHNYNNYDVVYDKENNIIAK